jgi:DivIVA domain-containing protein
VGTVLGYILALLVVGGVLFLAASYAFGRGEEMAPTLPDGTPLELPDDRLARGDDLRALKLSVAVRGYRMDEVDWLLDRLSEQVDTRDREIARLRSVLHVEPLDRPEDPELLTHPIPKAVEDSTPDDSSRGPLAGDRRTPAAEDDRWPLPGDGRRPLAGDDRWPVAGDDGRPVGGERPGPYPVPEGTGDTGARPDRPARDIRTATPPESE